MSEMYYTIKDVAERTGMSPSTLRFYDKKGLLTFVKRSASGIRMFSEEDFESLYVIHCLKSSGMSLEKIKEFMQLYKKGNSTIHQRKILFEQHREQIKQKLTELTEILEIVDYKCWFFSEAEKQGDLYYYKKIPTDRMPKRISEFENRVKRFRSYNVE